MVTPHRTEDYLLDSLREHVLTPLTKAERVVDAEREEVEAEREAFAEFGERVAGIGVVSTASADPEPPPRTAVVETPQRGAERVQTVFRETVISVDHYDEMYGETLEDHAAAELSGGVAAVLQPEVATPLTEWHRVTLISAVDAAVVGRRRLHNPLDKERASISENHAALVEFVDPCDGPTVSNRIRKPARRGRTDPSGKDPRA